MEVYLTSVTYIIQLHRNPSNISTVLIFVGRHFTLVKENDIPQSV